MNHVAVKTAPKRTAATMKRRTPAIMRGKYVMIRYVMPIATRMETRRGRSISLVSVLVTSQS